MSGVACGASNERLCPLPPLRCTSTMVLADLGRKLNAALSSLNRAPVVDEKVLVVLASFISSLTPCIGARSATQGSLCRSFGDRCQRETRGLAKTEGQGESKGVLRERSRQGEGCEQEEHRAEGTRLTRIVVVYLALTRTLVHAGDFRRTCAACRPRCRTI